MKLSDFGNLVKSKYQQYAEVPAVELAERVINKFPTYRQKISDYSERVMGERAQLEHNYGRETIRDYNTSRMPILSNIDYKPVADKFQEKNWPGRTIASAIADTQSKDPVWIAKQKIANNQEITNYDRRVLSQDSMSLVVGLSDPVKGSSGLDIGKIKPPKGVGAKLGNQSSDVVGSGIIIPSSNTSIKSPSDLSASLRDPSGSTILISKPALASEKSTNQTVSSNRMKFLSEFSMVSPSNKDYNRYYQSVNAQSDIFTSTLDDLARDSGGNSIYRLKLPKSLKDKLIKKNKKHPRSLGDINDTHAGTIVTDNIDDSLELAQNKYGITNVEDRRNDPSFLGYRGVHSNLELPNGQMGEVQFHSLDGMYQKEYAHTIYNKWRPYIEDNVSSGYEHVYRSVPEPLRKEFRNDVMKSRNIYRGFEEVPQQYIDLVNSRQRL